MEEESDSDDSSFFPLSSSSSSSSSASLSDVDEAQFLLDVEAGVSDLEEISPAELARAISSAKVQYVLVL